MQFTAEIVSLPEATDLQLILVERWENVDIMPTNTYQKKMCCHDVYTCILSYVFTRRRHIHVWAIFKVLTLNFLHQ